MARSLEDFAEQAWSAPTAFRDDLFRDRVVLVSGGGTGIGLAIALGFARLGARVAICGRKREKLDAAAAFAAGKGLSLLAHPVDIREPERIDALFDAVGQALGLPDILVNNAGGQFAQPAIDFSVKGWNAVIGTNLSGT